MNIKLPPIGPHDHPDPRSYKWDELEIRAIQDYAREAVRLNMAPLSDDQILKMVKEAPALDTAEAEWLHVARAVEAAHGIKGD
jgi:hypothetical protein